MWLIISIAGGVMEGNIKTATTELTQNLSVNDSTVYVRSTSGFPNTGTVVIGTERIAYSGKNSTSFYGSITSPLVRGANETGIEAHLIGDRVRTVESSMMNQSAQYNLTVITDATGPAAFVTVPLAVLRLIGSYLNPHLGFLGTDLAILSYLWWVMMAGMILTVGLQLAGTRRI